MPSLGMTTINALTAADSVIIPSQPSFLSTKGLAQLMGTIAKVRRQLNPGLQIDGVLLTMVDNRTNNAKSIISSLSYLKEEEQKELLENISYQDATPSLAQAIKMKKFSQEDRLTPEVIESIMTEEKPNQMKKFTMRADRLRKYIPRDVSQQKAEEFILKALEHYTRYLAKQRQNEAAYGR